VVAFIDQSQLTSALQTEYFHLQKTIEEFDGKAMTIKAWSVTFEPGRHAWWPQSVMLDLSIAMPHERCASARNY
jgi:hypothetical protein